MPGNEKKPSLLFIDHAYHARTKSTNFFRDILDAEYQVRTFAFDPHTDNPETHFRTLYGSQFDVVVLFQIMPDLNALRQHISAGKFVFLPMFDFLPPLEDDIWNSYRRALVLCFSSTLEAALRDRGFTTRLLCYWPVVPEKWNPGDPYRLFFWQRVDAISLDTAATLFRNIPLASIHHHRALDPGYYERPALEKPRCPVTESRWFPRKADLLRVMEASGLYLAPRLSEGIGMSFLEAMALGRCVVAPDGPTMNEYIEHGKTGILYDPENPIPLTRFDVRAIQYAARAAAVKGRHAWEKSIPDILQWIRNWTPPQEPKHGPLDLPIMHLGETRTTSVFWLLGILPVLRITASETLVAYRLFGFLPLLVKQKLLSSVSFWLLGVIRLWKSEVEHE